MSENYHNVLFLIFEPGEPATRMIPVVARLRDRLATRDLQVIPVLTGKTAAGPWRAKLTEAGLPDKIYHDSSGQLAEWLAEVADHGPVTMLILPDINSGRPVLLRSGLDNGVDFSVHLSLDANGVAE